MGDYLNQWEASQISNPNESSGDKTAQIALPIVGQVIGDFFGPIGGMVGHQAGVSTGNLIATGDLAGAAPGTWASNETNMGGLFQGQGLKGFGHYLLDDMLDPSSIMTMMEAAQGPQGQGYTTAPETGTSSTSGLII